MPTGKITPISNLVGKIDKGAGTNDHNRLINRDLANQHPIEAITGLLDALNQLDSKISTLDEKIDSEADFVTSELDKLRTELNTYKEFVNLEFIKTYEKIEATKEEIEVDVTNLQNQINVVETHLNEVETRFAEQIELVNTNLETAKQELNTRIDEEAAKAEIALARETGRAIKKENEIIEALKEEATTRAEADALLQESLTNEIERATEAETALQTNIDTETEIRENADLVLQANITNEETARIAADNALQEALNQEIADRVTDVDAEEARASAAETELREYTDAEITKLDKTIKEELEPRLTELSEAIDAEADRATQAEADLQEQINKTSIEELSRREVTRTYEAINPALNDKFVLATEYDATAKYYHKVLDIHTDTLTGTWKLKSYMTPINWAEWRAIMGREDAAYFYDDIYSYWYTPAGVKKSYSYFGLIQPTRNTGSEWDETDDIWGFGVSNRFYIDAYGMTTSPNSLGDGAILLPIRHTRLFDNSVVDYNPSGTPGYITPGFDTISFEIKKENKESKALASKLFTLIADKVSDTPLEYGDTNYKIRFDYVEITEEEFNENPNEYYIYQETFENKIDPSTLVADDKKETGYYPAYEYNENETYYELVYDSNINNVVGIWQWDDNLIPAIHTNEADREAGLEHTDFWCERGTFVWYDDSGRRIEHHAVGILGWNWLLGGYSGWRYRRFWDPSREEWMEGTDICPLGLGYGEANGVSWCGMQFEWAALYPKKDLIQQWKDSDISDEKGVYQTVDDYRDFLDSVLNGGKSTDSTYWYAEGMKKLWIANIQGGGSLLRYLKQNAVKLSDELLPYGNNNYKTKYVPTEVTSETFVPGKYFTYYDKENSQVKSNAFIISTKNYVETEQYYKILCIDKISKEPLYEKVTLTEQEFYAPDSDYYKLISFDPIEVNYDVVRIELDDDASIYRNGTGEDLIKITDNNVYVGGETLIPNLKVTNDTYATLLAENNAETVFDNPIENLQIVIPENVKHGFCFYTTFETGTTTPSITFNNKSHMPLKFIFAGAKVNETELDFATEAQYNLMFLCNGIYLEVYIQEIQLS